MTTELRIPEMGESITQVTIGGVFISSGSFVKAEAEILELETDKVNQILYAPISGELTLTVRTGDVVKIGQLIGKIDEKSKEQEKPPQSVQKTVEPALETKKESKIEEQKISSLPSFSQEKNVPRETRRPLSKIRKLISERLVQAQQTMAMLTTFNEIDLTVMVDLRQKHQEAFVKEYGCKLGFMSFFIKAAISALQLYPDLNSYLDGEEIVERHDYHIGVAVGTEKGVIVPVLRNCDQLTFAEIEQRLTAYAKSARESSLQVSDLQGAGFTITNGGVYGSLLSTPLIIPPQCAILGMHKIEKRAVVIEEQIQIRSMMYVALSYDHRLIDGKEAVSFLVHIKNELEDPSRLLIGL